MKKAFTLAEVLITLSIIGVISLLTIPSIVKNYRYRVYSSSIEKTYSQISNAIQEIMGDENSSLFYKTTAGVASDNTNCIKGACYFLKNYFKVARDNCGSATPKCYATSYTSTSGANAHTLTGDYCIQNTNGATICMGHNTTNHISHIFIDTNGPAQPNITGLDAFVAKVNNDGSLVDWSDDETKCNTKVTEFNHIADYATGCLAKVIKNGWKIEE